MLYLKQNSISTVMIGPFLDSTDGVTPETGLTINQADVRLSKNGGSFAQKNNTSGCTHNENGWYSCFLNGMDTGTLGRLQISVQISGALPVWHEFMVVPANVFDSLFGSDKLQVDVAEVSGDSTAADNLEADYDGTGYTKANSSIGNCMTNTDMRGTDNAALASVCTEERLSELDASNIPADVDTLLARVPAEVAQKQHLVNGSGDITPPTNKGIWDVLGDGTKSISDLNDLAQSDILSDATPFAGADVAAIKAKTDNLPEDPADDSDIDNQLSTITTHLTDIKGTGFVKDTHSLPQCLTATGFSTHSAADVAGAVWDEAKSGHTSAGSFGEEVQAHATSSELTSTKNEIITEVDANETKIDAIKTITDSLSPAVGQLITGTVSSADFTPTMTEFEANDITESTDDHFNGRLITFTSGSLAGQQTDITDYTTGTGGKGHFTVTALTEAPSNGDTFVIQ